MYQTIQKQSPFAAAQEDRAGLFSSVEAEKKDRSGLSWTGRPVFLQRQNMQQESSPQNLQSTKKLPVQMRPVVQRQYYNPIRNKIKERPSKTAIIKAAKRKAQSSYPGNPQNWTAHHKFPWEKIKENIENAFEIDQQNPHVHFNTFLGLEAFANKRFPVNKQDFTSLLTRRFWLYTTNKDKIDEWIRHVCWSPKNIFIGPVANNRVDDPGKRTGDQKTDLDAHYTRPRSKSIRSAKLTSIADLNLTREDRKSIGHMKQSTAEYKSSEWVKYILNRKPHYYQKDDPYFEEHIPAQYLYYASISSETSSGAGRGAVTEYELHFETLYDFSIHDLTFRLSLNNQSPVNYLYQNSALRNQYDATSFIIADRHGSNSRIYTICFKVPGKDTNIYNVKAVIMNGSGKTVECPIHSVTAVPKPKS